MTIHSLLSNKVYSHKKVLEKLIAHRLKQDTMRVLAHLDHEIFDEDFQWIQKSYHSYSVEKQPLEYILGHVSFLGYDFMVDRNTLIPRPETEYMITAVVKELETRNKKQEDKILDTGSLLPATLIDVGTGCGVLGLSCILHGSDYLDQVYLTEFYPETLEVAKKNLNNYKLQTTNLKPKTLELLGSTELLHCSLLDHPTLKNLLQTTNYKLEDTKVGSLRSEVGSIIIVANLPYIPEQLFEDNVEDNVKLREPKPAFVGGEDGLDWYRIMLTQITNYKLETTNPILHTIENHLKSEAGSLKLFLEMMTRQVEILAREFTEHFSFEEVATFHMNIRIVKCIFLG